MLRRKPSRVEERADVADEYELYVRAKEREKGASEGQEDGAERQAAELARQRREAVRARVGLPPAGALPS